MTCPSRKDMSMFRGREDIQISGKDSGHLARALVDIRESSHTNSRAFGPAFGVHRESWEFGRKRISTKVSARCPESLPDDGPKGMMISRDQGPLQNNKIIAIHRPANPRYPQ